MKIIAKYVISFISALLISLIGIVIEAAELQNTVIVPVLSVLSIIPIILFLLNIILAKRYINKINQTKVADMQSYMLRHRKEAAEASGRLLKKLRRIRIFTSIYAIIIWLLAGCIAVLGGVLYDFGFYLYILFLLYSGIVFYAVYSRISKKDRELFKEKLSLLDMGLEDRMSQPVGLLSGGQRQALTLLMATIVPPRLLLLDEHTAALDPAAAEKVLKLTEEIVGEHKITCMMVTHNMHQALSVGNRTLMMEGGSIVLDISGPERESMTVRELIGRFRAGTGKDLDNDRILLS